MNLVCVWISSRTCILDVPSDFIQSDLEQFVKGKGCMQDIDDPSIPLIKEQSARRHQMRDCKDFFTKPFQEDKGSRVALKIKTKKEQLDQSHLPSLLHYKLNTKTKILAL
ncbi:unnamed protein product [Cuscuta epithymum]|uniref:Uncharacterized protein n=1 Tax=Cuscuta epithymum TaxID=186058 RepID=A0AAV0DUA7_9ASTE|nr:unnamed protein product [Cuscuta epithymum]